MYVIDGIISGRDPPPFAFKYRSALLSRSDVAVTVVIVVTQHAYANTLIHNMCCLCRCSTLKVLESIVSCPFILLVTLVAVRDIARTKLIFAALS